jgi:hypothetical protein
MQQTQTAGDDSQSDDDAQTTDYTGSPVSTDQETQVDPLSLSENSYGLRRYRLGSETYFLDTTGERPPRLLRRVTATNDPERCNDYDGPILYDGEVVGIEDNLATHSWMGHRDYLPHGRLTTAALLLTEVSR